MSYEKLGRGALDYFPCSYGASTLMFRGPKRSMQGDYLAFLGGTETYGKFLQQPYPVLVEQELAMECVNLGWPNAGIDVFLNEPDILRVAAHSKVCIIQILGGQNMSNRFYTVHPRRNDRFLQPSPLLRTVYREVDFTEFHFTRHMLQALVTLSPEKFRLVVEELRSAWVARMRQLLTKIDTKTVLIWMSGHSPGCVEIGEQPGNDPFGIDRTMLDEIAPEVDALVEIVATPETGRIGTEGLVFDDMDALAARKILGCGVHEEAAKAPVPVIRELTEK